MSGANEKVMAEKEQIKEVTKIEPLFKFKVEMKDKQIEDAIINSYKLHSPTYALTELAEKIKLDLDEKFPKGWIVFAGKHMVGACSHIKDTLADFEVDGVSFVAFQTFCPE